MSNDIYFDNFIITDSKEVADEWAADTWELKHSQEMLASSSGVSCGRKTRTTSDNHNFYLLNILKIPNT